VRRECRLPLETCRKATKASEVTIAQRHGSLPKNRLKSFSFLDSSCVNRAMTNRTLHRRGCLRPTGKIFQRSRPSKVYNKIIRALSATETYVYLYLYFRKVIPENIIKHGEAWPNYVRRESVSDGIYGDH